MRELVVTAFLSLLPISELRGAIPYALYNGMSPVTAYAYCVSLNALVGPIVYVFLSTFHRMLLRLKWYESLFGRFIESSRHKVEDQVRKYGYLGIALFVAIPLPITGAYTGTLGAWVLGMNRKRTVLAVIVGVCISGLIVTTVTALGLEALSIFIKRPEA